MDLIIMVIVTVLNVAVLVATAKLIKDRKVVMTSVIKDKDVLTALGYFIAREEALTEEHLKQLRRSLYKLEQSGVAVERFRSLAKRNYKLDVEGK